jgi:hypothetical protein
VLFVIGLMVAPLHVSRKNDRAQTAYFSDRSDVYHVITHSLWSMITPSTARHRHDAVGVCVSSVGRMGPYKEFGR